MNLTIKNDNKFTFIDEGKGEVVVLLHGLFGALSNWNTVIDHFKNNFRIIIPMLPLYTVPVRKAKLSDLNEFLESFVDHMNLSNINLVGNSLGGHLGLIYTLKNQEKVKKLILTGSSGLFEDSMGGSFPKRGSYDYIKDRVAYTFYDPKTASQQLVDEVFEITRDIQKCMRVIAIAKSAQRHNMAKDISKIIVPTLLVWGLNDTITPPVVAHEFNRLIPNSTLKFTDECCHAPMMEKPQHFNEILEEFLG